MPKMQKIFPMIALAALMMALTHAPANAKSEGECKHICKDKFSNSAYVRCKEETHCSKIPGKDKKCKHACAKKHPSPQYDSCKKKCLEEKTSSKKGKRFRR
jgi:hypothetical protein